MGEPRRRRCERRPAPTLSRAGLWAGLLVVAYTHVGYPALAALAARSKKERSAPAAAGDPEVPAMSVVIAALNEEPVIGEKIRDTLAQDYPAGRLEVIVVADGSTDETAAVAARHGVRVLWEPDRRGKCAAVNCGVAAATGELVCLTDANCTLAPGSLRALATAFSDPQVAMVSGAKTVSGRGAKGRGEGLYWRYEDWLKRSESALRCTMGTVGEICGLRRSLFRPIPEGIIADDYYSVCDVLARGYAVRYAPEAVASEPVSPRIADEFERRTRIGASVWQVTLANLHLCDPRRGWAAVAFVSHRLLRNVVVPVLLPTLWLLAARAGRDGDRRASMLFQAQSAAWGAAACGAALDAAPLAVPFQFALANVATLAGAWRFLRGQQPAAWRKVRK